MEDILTSEKVAELLELVESLEISEDSKGDFYVVLSEVSALQREKRNWHRALEAQKEQIDKLRNKGLNADMRSRN